MFMISLYFKNIRSLLRLTHLNLWAFALSLVLLMASSLFEGVSLGLFVPLLGLLMKGGDISFLTQRPVLQPFFELWPALDFKTLFLGMLAGIVVAVAVK